MNFKGRDGQPVRPNDKKTAKKTPSQNEKNRKAELLMKTSILAMTAIVAAVATTVFSAEIERKVI